MQRHAVDRQALRQRAAMWTTPGEQPPLFYFMRKDLTEYLTKASLSSLTRPCCNLNSSSGSIQPYLSWNNLGFVVLTRMLSLHQKSELLQFRCGWRTH